MFASSIVTVLALPPPISGAPLSNTTAHERPSTSGPRRLLRANDDAILGTRLACTVAAIHWPSSHATTLPPQHPHMRNDVLGLSFGIQHITSAPAVSVVGGVDEARGPAGAR